MALVNLGLAWTDAYTEGVGARRFAERLPPEALRARVRWHTLFPGGGLPPGPPGERFDAHCSPRRAPRSPTGATGAALVGRVAESLERDRCRSRELDAVVMFDDADCRFCPNLATTPAWAQLRAWRSTVESRWRDASDNKQLRAFIFLASPEVEGWLLSSWKQTFDGDPLFREHAVPIRLALKRHLRKMQINWNSIEAYGCPQSRGSCAHKLSTRLAEVVRLTSPASAPNYSKFAHGGPMLLRAEPSAIRRRCQSLFRPAHDEFLTWLAQR